MQILNNTIPILTKKTTDKICTTDNKRNHTQTLISFWFCKGVVVYTFTKQTGMSSLQSEEVLSHFTDVMCST